MAREELFRIRTAAINNVFDADPYIKALQCEENYNAYDRNNVMILVDPKIIKSGTKILELLLNSIPTLAVTKNTNKVVLRYTKLKDGIPGVTVEYLGAGLISSGTVDAYVEESKLIEIQSNEDVQDFVDAVEQYIEQSKSKSKDYKIEEHSLVLNLMHCNIDDIAMYLNTCFNNNWNNIETIASIALLLFSDIRESEEADFNEFIELYRTYYKHEGIEVDISNIILITIFLKDIIETAAPEQ